jgi:hypothetical protein
MNYTPHNQRSVVADVSRWEIVNNWNIVFLSNIFYWRAFFGISLSLILYMEPTTIPYIFQAAIAF